MSGWNGGVNMKRSVLKRSKLVNKPINKATKRKQLKIQLDKIAREICFAIYENKCVTCGREQDLQWSHLFRREPEATRWHRLNTAVQCKPCHYYHHRVGNDKYTNWFLEKYGQDQYQELYRLHHSTVKSTIQDLEEMINAKKNELARILMAKGNIVHEQEIPF